jgi:hypothetical protein
MKAFDMTEFYPPKASSQDREDGTFMTYDAVEARLVDAVRWWRRPEGRWPFAGDGPWHLIRKEWWDWDARDPKRLRDGAPSPAEIDRMEEATGWLGWLEDDGKRRALVAGLVDLAKGRRHPGWSAMRERLGEPGLSGAAVQYRYSQAIRFIANVLNFMSGSDYAPKGMRVRYPKAVVAQVERLRMAKNCGRRPSSPVME